MPGWVNDYWLTRLKASSSGKYHNYSWLSCSFLIFQESFFWDLEKGEGKQAADAVVDRFLGAVSVPERD